MPNTKPVSRAGGSSRHSDRHSVRNDGTATCTASVPSTMVHRAVVADSPSESSTACCSAKV